MKPNKPVARRGDYSFREIPHKQGADFIAAHHYARGCSKTGKMYGMFRGHDLVGVAQWLPPTKVCAQSVLPEFDLWKRVISLTRRAVRPSEPQNAESMLISAALRWVSSLRDESGRRKWLAAVTFADESEGHTGGIYKATNWLYKGVTAAYPRWVDPKTGRQVATKAGPNTRTAAQMRSAGYEMLGKYRKHKFVKYFSARGKVRR